MPVYCESITTHEKVLSFINANNHAIHTSPRAEKSNEDLDAQTCTIPSSWFPPSLQRVAVG